MVVGCFTYCHLSDRKAGRNGHSEGYFGSNGDRVTPSENEAERDARSDYIEEAWDNDGRDPTQGNHPFG